MYEARLRRNLLPVLLEHGVDLRKDKDVLESLGWRHAWNVTNGMNSITVRSLEALADEVGADMMDFFRE